MSHHLVRALGGLTAIVVVTTLSGGTASAREPDPGPGPSVIQAKADGTDHFTSVASVAMAAGGTANVVSPTLPKDMTKAKVEVSTSLSDEPGFKEVAFALMREPKPGKRLMACIVMARNAVALTAWSAAMQDDLDAFNAVADQLFLARLNYCMQVARLVASLEDELAGSGRLAGTACGQVPLGITEKVTQANGQFTVTKDGPGTVKKKNAGGVKVRCKHVSGTKAVLTIKAKKKGQSLRKALGSDKLAVALGSADDASSGATVKVAFKAP